MKIKSSPEQKIKSLLEQIGLGELWMKAHYADVGIINMIRQRLKDIELQRWLSEISNDTRKDANQSNKIRTYQLFKMKNKLSQIAYNDIKWNENKKLSGAKKSKPYWNR